jgi:hypothetical protein
LLGIGVLWVAVAGCETRNVGGPQAKQAATGTVSVEIDFHGRRESRNFEIPVNPDSTVLSVLQQAHQAGDLELDFSGTGPTAFIRSIDGIENEQAAGDNWTYHVNGQLGDRSCGVFPLKTGDQILWRFGKYP